MRQEKNLERNINKIYYHVVWVITLRNFYFYFPHFS